ncbi:ParB/RepB/Spo0J family partition protein [Staphylococcus simiae]|uniref:ParB-like partition protein n=1 Tax=Staphylococcus simiae CCM 7213 = CCUG 51256 TaxID=911238 RepID=G5JL20_9STAP|nr:ParB/RepB/Spo0J family partition protein [Staphylococcus simiae]EHJ07107.1 ParB-like partition protein [Staphylococcus simiae CCM 7213 = CCUG 51256]SNV60283.1 ParB family partitioning protein [Staphylococcus simiae]
MNRLVTNDDQRLIVSEDEQVIQIKLEQIKANPYQPRKTFDDIHLNNLADSIKQYGILQPIVVRKTIQGYYIVVGERRFRASKLAGLTTIPAIIKDLSDEDMMELAVIENLQREDLNAIEEAESYQRLMRELNITQREVAKRLSKSRSYIANMLRLLHLPQSIMVMVKKGDLSGAHGRTLLAIKNQNDMVKIARRVAKEHWSVRQLEQYINEIKQNNNETKDESKAQYRKPKFIAQQERQLKEQYGTKVDISTTNKVGKITFEFKSQEEFEILIKQLNVNYGK